MKKTLIITAALGMASVASADDYNFYWDGSQDSNYTTEWNWHSDASGTVADQQWVPTGSNTYAHIGVNGAESGDITWNNVGVDIKGLYLGGGSSLTLTGWGNFNTKTVEIGTGSSLIIGDGDGDIGGFDGDTTVDITGALTSTDSAKLVFEAGTFWGADTKTIVLTGTLDLSALPNSIGSLTLVNINNSGYGVTGTNIQVDYSGLTLINNNVEATLKWTASGDQGNGKLVLSYVPEPTTATLSLLALAGFAARRRRK